MRSQLILGVLIASAMAGVLANAQAPTPFKLGTFDLNGRTFVGVVIKDSTVIDLAAASAALKTPAAKVAMPAWMSNWGPSSRPATRRALPRPLALPCARPAGLPDPAMAFCRPS